MSIRIAICGIDGSGKTQLVDGLFGYYKKKGECVAKTDVNFKCKSTCKDIGLDACPEIIRVGMAFDFVNHYKRIKSNCRLLLCDRYDVCYRVLNNVDLKDVSIIEMLDKIYSSIPDADLYVLLDVSAEIAASRLDSRGNREKNETLEILNSMRYYYNIELYKKNNVIVVDAAQSAEAVLEAVCSKIDEILEEYHD